MEEKTIIKDLIFNLKSELNLYQTSINDSENIEIRQILQQIRNDNEALLYEIFKVAKIKKYINPLDKAEMKEIESIKKETI